MQNCVGDVHYRYCICIIFILGEGGGGESYLFFIYFLNTFKTILRFFFCNKKNLRRFFFDITSFIIYKIKLGKIIWSNFKNVVILKPDSFHNNLAIITERVPHSLPNLRTISDGPSHIFDGLGF